MTGALRDLRHAVRALAGTPGFTLVATLVLALGIGVNAAIFSVVNAVVLRPLPYPEADRLVELYLPAPGGSPRGPVSAIDFQDWREENDVFEGIALVNTLARGLTLTGGEEPEQLATAYVHPALFPTLGVAPALGRALALDENAPGRDGVVVLSHRLWRRRFGADPAVAGRVVTLDGRPFTVAGVMPERFRFPDAAVDVWAPESLIDAARAPRRRDTRYQRVVARLGRGVTLERAAAEMDTIAARLSVEHPDTNAGRDRVTIVPLHEAVVGDAVRAALLVLLGAVGCVLLIACANVGNLLVARTEARRREIAVRLALGAGRARIVRQLLIESLVLAAVGGALGLALGAWSLDGLLALSRDFLPAQNDVVVDRQVLLFTLGASVVAAVLFGVAPAVRISRADPLGGLREGGRGMSAGAERRRLRAVLVVAETALAVVLVVGAGLMIRSFGRLLRVDPGFDPEGLLTVSMNASSSRYPERPGYVAFYREVLARVRGLPGVRAAGSTRNLPLQGAAESWPVVAVGRVPVPEESRPFVAVHPISPDYLRAMGIPLLQGRAFTEADREEAPAVAIVSRAMARRLWPGEDPVSRALRYGPAAVTVVGVAGDVRQRGLDAAGEAAMYVPQAQDPRRGFTLVIRAEGDPRALAPAVRRAVRDADPEHPIIRIATMEEVMDGSIARPRLMSLLLGAFGGLALGLAALGIYGVIAYAVSLRAREFGIRMALGAAPRDVRAIVLREGAGMSLAGVALGTAAALGLTRFLASQLYGVEATDAATFLGVAALLLATSLAASYLPARRATRVDPLAALRAE